MLCNKFELIPTSIFQVMAILRKLQNPEKIPVLKFVENPNLIGISSNLKHNLSTCICIRKKYKNGEFSTFHFWRHLTKIPVL